MWVKKITRTQTSFSTPLVRGEMMASISIQSQKIESRRAIRKKRIPPPRRKCIGSPCFRGVLLGDAREVRNTPLRPADEEVDERADEVAEKDNQHPDELDRAVGELAPHDIDQLDDPKDRAGQDDQKDQAVDQKKRAGGDCRFHEFLLVGDGPVAVPYARVDTVVKGKIG